jgi:hypothetical protein
MMIKVSNEFLDFDELIEVEKQIKLFEDISTTDGDFSYSFELEKTLNNTKLLQNPFPDNISKPVYQKIPAKLLSESGAETYDGYLRVEKITPEVYECSFFSGNNNWFGLLADPLQDLGWNEFNLDQTEANIVSTFTKTEGIVFPVLDNGMLNVRGNAVLKPEDFIAGIYVKTVFEKIFNSHGIKIQGELLNNTKFLSLITVSNGKSEAEINARTAFVKTTNAPTNHASAIYTKIVWTDDSNFPYFDGSADNFDLPNSRYVADVPMIIKVEWIINNTIAPGIGQYRMAFYINGVNVYEEIWGGAPAQPLALRKTLRLNPGDQVEAYVYDDAQLFSDPLTDSTIRFTPIYLYKTFGTAMVPDWTQQQYVSEVLKLFNAICSYNEGDRTLTINLFDKVKDKPPIDLSEYISETEVDYAEFISEYGRQSLFSYQELETNDDFKAQHFDTLPYSKGVIEVENEFLPDSQDVLESEFTSPVTYLNPIFDMSIEKTDLIALSDGDESTNATSVSDASGVARFNIDDDIFQVGDLVRIEDSTNPRYNFDWIVSAIGSGYVEFQDLPFHTNATAKLKQMLFVYSESDNVFILQHIPNYEVSKFSSHSSFIIGENAYTDVAVAFFDLIQLSRPINEDFIYSLSFGGDSVLRYQVNMIDQFFRLFSRVLNDPVKLIQTAQMPYDVYNRIDFLRPITVKTLETSNMYYLNRITGYKESFLDCTLENIKI